MCNHYAGNALQYLKAGYSVIPDSYMKKKPAIKGWAEFSKRMPSQEEVNGWASSFSKSNIALCLGRASGIIAVDVDTEDPDKLKLIRELLPASPCEKVGAKGFTRFYRYKGEPTSVLKDENGEVILEVLSVGKKTTIPPSMHTSGKPYEWVGKSLIEIPKDSLPLLPPLLLSTLELEFKASKLHTPLAEKQMRKGGRHSYLGAIASQLIADRMDVTSAVMRLIKEDSENHEIPLFTDKKENQTDNAFMNALEFYQSFFKSINNKRLSEGLAPELPLPSSFDTTISKPDLKQEKVALPIPTGALKEISDFILAKSYVEQPVFALSAAISLLGTLARNRFTFQGATPNTYILNIADSGSGKDSAQQAIKQIMRQVDASGYLGATSYPSEASITANLTNANPVRLDIIDEASSFLQIAANGATGYQAGIGDTLCELYSCSNEHYLGKVLATRDGDRVGECYRPHLSLLCSTTYKGISESLTRATLEKGLFARFLTFFGENNRPGKRVFKEPKLPYDTKELLKELVYFKNPTFIGNNPLGEPPVELKCTEEADTLLGRYHREFDLMRTTSNGSSATRPIIARLYQQMMKIVLISAISNKQIDLLPKVTASDVEFGYKVVMYFFQSIEEFVNDNLFDSIRGKNTNLVLRLIKDAGVDGILSSDLTKETKSITTRDRQDIIRDLVSSRQIEMVATGDGVTVLFRSLK